MCTVKPVGNGGRKTTPSGIIYYEDTAEGHAAQQEDMVKSMGPGAGESAHPGEADIPPNPNPPDTKDCTAYTDAMWDTSCSKYFKFSQMKMKPEAQKGLTVAQIACNWQKLCQNILDPIQEAGMKLNFNSAFRTVAFNTQIKGSPVSDHLTGCAVDIQIGNAEANKKLFNWG